MIRAHGRLSPLLRQLASLPLLRRVRRLKAVDRIVEAHYRGSACTRPLLYTVREATGRRTVHRYRPRGSEIDVLLRHNTSDGNILQEFAMHRLYDEPASVASQLMAIARPRFVDLGAHIGLFGAHILSRYPNGSLTSIEADPDNAALLRRTAAASGRSWRVIEAAATTTNGRVGFAAGRFAESRIDPTGTEVVALDVFDLLADCDLAKVDIEGGEWSLLADPRFAGLRCAVVLEWHPHDCPSRDPEAAAKRGLESAGFSVASVSGAPPGVGMIWGWREAPIAQSPRLSAADRKSPA
jgi:FkbM family methyltransferase